MVKQAAGNLKVYGARTAHNRYNRSVPDAAAFSVSRLPGKLRGWVDNTVRSINSSEKNTGVSPYRKPLRLAIIAGMPSASPPLPNASNVWRPLLVLAWPVLTEQVLSMLVGYTDWILTGWNLPGAGYQAAMALMAYMLWLLPSMFAAVSIGATALIARSTGAGDQETAIKAMHQSLLTGGVLAVAATLACGLFSGPFVRMMQLSSESAPLAATYLLILTPAVPFIMLERVGAACLRGAGDTVTGFVAKTVMNIVNVLVSLTLVTGWGPFPQLGWHGSAIGTACGYVTGGVLIFIALLAGRGGLQLQWWRLVPDADIIRRLLKVGLPGGLDVAVLLACHMVYLSIINRLGDLGAASHGLGIQIEALAYMPGAAFQVAATTMAGQYLGAGDPRRAARSVWAACIAAGVLMSLAGCGFYFGGAWIASVFTRDLEVAFTTAKLLKIVAFSMPSLAIAMVIAGGLRGAGDTRWPMLITLAGFAGVRIPLAIVLAYSEFALPFTGVAIAGAGMHVTGAWLAMLIDVVLRSLLLTGRFLHGGWKHTEV